jgi:cobalt-zinc-cadmium efflux system outer membrane protein
MMKNLTRFVSALALAGVALQPATVLGQAEPVDPTGLGAAPESAAAAAGPVATGPALALDAVVEEALEHNPEIAAMARNFDMMKARVPQAKAWPEPMVEVASMGNIVPFDVQNGDPSSNRMVGVTQEIMWPGKLSLMGKMAGAEAEAEWWAFEQTRRMVVADVKAAYFDLAYLTKALETVAKNRVLMERVAKIAEARYSVGRGMQQDVLKAQLEVVRMTEMLWMLEQRRDSAAARLNTLLYREPDSPLGAPEEIARRPFDYTIEALEEMALTSPVLKQQKSRIDREQYALRLAEKQYYPDMSVGYSWVNRPGMPEMHGFTFGVKLPLYFWQKQRPGVAEAASATAAERKRLENAHALLFFKIKDAYLMAVTSEKLVDLYATATIPMATLTLESGIAAYESGSIDFLMLLDDLKTLFTYELGYYEQLANVEKAIAMLEPLVGTPLR